MTALALRDDQTQWDDRQLAVLQAGGIDEDVTEPELMAFLHECQRRQLDPFSRQIYLIGRKDKAKGRKVYRSQTSIDGFRLIARRAADKSGIDYSYEDTIWFDDKGGRHEIWLSQQQPAGAKVVVVRNGSRYDAVARFGAYVQTGYDGSPLKQWRSMPDVMIAKCAEALALRKAFPEDLGGIYTEDEMGQADNPQRVTATAEVIRDEPAPANGHNGNGTPADERPWAEVALERAGTFTSEAEGNALWRETAARAANGECTPKQKDHIQNRVVARIKARRREASNLLLRQLPESASDWKAAVEGLDGDDIEACREALEEIGRLKGERNMDEVLAARIGRAIIALCPKAAIDPAGDDGA